MPCREQIAVGQVDHLSIGQGRGALLEMQVALGIPKRVVGIALAKPGSVLTFQHSFRGACPPQAREATEVGFLALSRMQRELSVLFGRSVDLVPRAGLKPVIASSVLKEAEPLYAE